MLCYFDTTDVRSALEALANTIYNTLGLCAAKIV